MGSRGLAGVVALLLAGLVLAACDDLNLGDGVRGSGNVISESREVSGFDEIVLLGSGEVTVSVTGTESLTIEAEDNIMPILTSEVDDDGRLELGSDEPFSATRTIVYTITASSLNNITINGSGEITAAALDRESFSATVNGSGDITLSGESNALVVDINGSGDFHGEGLSAEFGTVSISGSGSAVVDVSEQLVVRISGSGDVDYIGNPTIDSRITGSGSVSQR